MIDTDRLTLRPYSLPDYLPYLAMCSDADVVRFIGGEPLSPEEAWHRVMRYAGHWSLLGNGIFAVIEKGSGQYIGETGIADFHRGLGEHFDQAGEAAWVFSSQVHGRGYAFEAAEAAHIWYAAHKGHERTVCLVHPENHSSLKLAEKLGYAAFGEQSYKGHRTIMLERRPVSP
jgi:RimJ/RimL family protein N-acetyltransferase